MTMNTALNEWRVTAPDEDTMKRFRREKWGDSPLADSLGDVHSLLAHAPKAGQDFLDIHLATPLQRIERVIATCALALKDRPQLADRLRRIVPALAQEKLRRSGVDPLQFTGIAPKQTTKTEPVAC